MLSFKNNNKGTALLMTILILNVVVLVSLAAAGLVNSGVKMGGTQAKSTKAYFAAEAGAERALWEWRKNQSHNFWVVPCIDTTINKFNGVLPNGSSFQIDCEAVNSLTSIFRTTGTFTNSKRTVETELDF